MVKFLHLRPDRLDGGVWAIIRRMLSLSALRHSRFLTRAVLAWFVLSLGAAIAAPLLQPQGLALVCSTAGAVKLVAQGPDGAPAPASHAPDCVLCLAFDAPPPQSTAAVVPPADLAYGLAAAALAAPATRRSAAALPARGPPAVLSS